MKQQYDKSRYDVIIIGSGPAGMAAAVSAADGGASVCLVEREEQMGGILKQCIHDGFGLIRFAEKLTGPEYAWRYRQMVEERDIDFLKLTFLTAVKKSSGVFHLSFVNPDKGVFEIEAAAMVTAMGCRERTDRQIFLHGSRPAGIFTAGQAQDFINLKGYMPGKKCVILGSGDIGLIMARRLTLEGAEVAGVYEIGSSPSGLTRNIVQCLDDFDIPLHLDMTVTEVHGCNRIEAVTICRVDGDKRPIAESAFRLECDSLVLSVGLVPENDILMPLGVEIDPATKGPAVDQSMQTSVEGLFSCGNALHVSDLVDYVSESGHAAGEAAAEYALTDEPGAEKGSGRECLKTVELINCGGLQYVVPQKLRVPMNTAAGLKTAVFFRPKQPQDKAEFVLKRADKIIYSRKLHWLKPSEMHRLEIDFSSIIGPGDPEELYLELISEGAGNE